MPPAAPRRVPVAAALLLVAGACADPSAPAAPAAGVAPLARVAAASGASARPIADQYIVVFRDDVTDAPGLARRLAAAQGTTPRHSYQHAIKGFAAPMSAQAAAALARHPSVAYVEQDQTVSVSTTQSNATWGLDRIDQRAGTDGTYGYASTGAGVSAYILDTGIRLTHGEFAGRIASGYDAIDGGTADDCNGHGTHVAGTVGGTTWGVAKGVRLVAVRVLDCAGSGTMSGVVAGVDWVTANHVKPAVANMSLGGGASTSLDAAVQRSVAAGVSYVVAAGNGDANGQQLDACTTSPARVGEAVTIGATNGADQKASWSNYGSCVDFFAPGVSITSAWYTGDAAAATASGTSMAAPHVAGAAARYLQDNPGASPLAVRDALLAATTKGVVTSSSTANNHLLYADPAAAAAPAPAPAPPANVAPTAAFTYTCSNLVCTFTDGSSDADGSIASRSWAFGDGGSSTATNPSRTYAAAGTYTVTLTVTDNAGATSATSKSVTVTAPSAISLSARAYKVKGLQTTDLSWNGATSANVDIFRNGARVATTANDRAHTDAIGAKGGGSYTYRVCEAGTTTCSASVTVTF